jgi:hypothetical protein
MVRRLRRAFDEAVEFWDEFERNIINGGAVIRTGESFEPRDLVEVELELGFCGESVVLEAEIVHVTGAEQAGSESGAAVAVQFLEPAQALRDRLQRFVPEDEGTGPDKPGLADPGSVDLGADEGLAEPDPIDSGTNEDLADLDRRDLFGEDDISGADFEDLFEDGRVEGADEADFSARSVADTAVGVDTEAQTVVAERRRAPRVQARVQARVDAKTISLEGRTRDLSEAGVLVSADASDLPIGKAVNLELAHPVSGDRLEVDGTVSRHVETEGTVAAVGIEFGRDAADSGVATFVNEVSQAEQELKRAGIYGVIEELGMQTLVHMFGMNAKRGTLTLVSGVEDGSVGFESGTLREARQGELRGVKALARLLSWERGSFEFHARLDPVEGEPDAMPLEDALAQAARQHEDAIQATHAGTLGPATRFTIDGEALRGELGLTKSQEAVLDLVAVGFTVRRILDVIPQPDAEVVEALQSLLDAEILRPA